MNALNLIYSISDVVVSDGVYDEYTNIKSFYMSSGGDVSLRVFQRESDNPRLCMFNAVFRNKMTSVSFNSEDAMGAFLDISGVSIGEWVTDDRVELTEKGKGLLSSKPYLSSITENLQLIRPEE